MKYYAVYYGHKPGVYDSWEECQKYIIGYSNAIYKKFSNKDEAENFAKFGTINGREPHLIKIFHQKKQKKFDHEIDIYTDGSSIKKNGISYAGYGIYIPVIDEKLLPYLSASAKHCLVEPDRNIKNSYILSCRKTNNRAELSAIIDAIKMFDFTKSIRLNIYTDSQYGILIFTTLGEKYKRKNFKSKGENIINKDLVILAMELKEKYHLNFIHIRSHTGLHKQNLCKGFDNRHYIGNAIADQLAVHGSIMDYVHNVDISAYKLEFGRHKKKLLSNVPIPYLEWMICANTKSKYSEEYLAEIEIVTKYLYNKQTDKIGYTIKLIKLKIEYHRKNMKQTYKKYNRISKRLVSLFI